jgi:hypothetical protein
MLRSSRSWTVEALADAVATHDIDLVVVGSLPLRTLSMVAELRKRAVVPVLCAREAAAPRTAEGGNRLLCVGLSLSGRRAVIKFLRAHGGPADRAVVLSARPLSEADLLELREVAGIAPTVEVSSGPHQPFATPLGSRTLDRGFDLVVVPRFPPVVLLGIASGPSVLILPHSARLRTNGNARSTWQIWWMTVR